MAHTFYSVRTGKNKNTEGFEFPEFLGLFFRAFQNFREGGYFDEYLGTACVDMGPVPGKVPDVELDILLKVRKNGIWPIASNLPDLGEDDVFDLIEYLYQNVSKPIDGTYHDFAGCGMHWETFNKSEGQAEFAQSMNELLALYKGSFELSPQGEILHKPEKGFEPIFEADVPSNDDNIMSRVSSAVLRYRRHGSTIDDRRQAVRDLADVLEYLRPQVKSVLTKQDEKDLFNLANNFGIRHHNDQQKTGYDAALWLSWMFYYYLSTIHVLLRKLGHDSLNQ
ncbi:hypothetical protein [Litchfieldella xinjiangensis]|uniref:hypothetical protein n=1 Tax=Litchfieldella xinjiangensis TaxID=1166948 RepID=UPI0005B9057F|nr:hypothetical protein [Halomonas xinjiangensis]